MDLRYALRTLARTPGFTAMAVVTLALGIGLNTVVFSIYTSVALRKLPVPAAGEIVRLEWRSQGFSSDQFSWGEYERLAKEVRSFREIVATSIPQTMVWGADAVRVRVVSANYFGALGVAPAMGRAFGSADHDAAIASHDFWTTKLHADPQIYGKTLRVQGADLQVLGVAPKKFLGTGVPPQAPDLWLSASPDHGAERKWQVLARSRPGVNFAAELAVLSKAWPLQAGQPIELHAVPATFFDTEGGGFQAFAVVCTVLLVAVTLILLMGCVNLVNLIEARNSGRAQEVAIRLALGASRWRLIRQFCVESLVLGMLGGLAGFFLSAWSCGWLEARAMELLQQIGNHALEVSLDLSPDWRVMAWTAALSVVAGISVGILPAFRASESDVGATLKGGGLVRRRHNFLLTAQVASCLILLTAAGLLFRGASRSAAINPGFDWKHLALVGTGSGPLQMQREALTRVKALPEVVSVAWADRVPFLGTGSGPFQNEKGAVAGCVFNGVSRDYFETLGIPIVAGRSFIQQEIDQEAPVALISEAMARREWPGSDPIGRKIVPAAEWLRAVVGHESLTVIGVAKTVRSAYLSKADEGYVYMPRRLRDTATSFLVRTRTSPESALRSLSKALPERTYLVSMEQGPVRMQELMAEAPAVAASVLGSLALALACLGIFGVVSRLVSLRTREIGIRMALGATRQDVIGLVGRETLRPAAWGAAAGLVGAFGVSGLLRGLIVMPDVPDLTYGAGAFDPVTFLGTLGMLVAVIVIATFVPMRRATLIEPAVALRDE